MNKLGSCICRVAKRLPLTLSSKLNFGEGVSVLNFRADARCSTRLVVNFLTMITPVILAFLVGCTGIASGRTSSTPAANLATSSGRERGVAALQVTTAALVSGTVQSSYSATLAAKGGVAPYSWSVTGGQLPNGLSVDSRLETSRVRLWQAGSFGLTITVKDSKTNSASSALYVNDFSCRQRYQPFANKHQLFMGPLSPGCELGGRFYVYRVESD